MKRMTSETHPIRVDWLPLELAGRIGMTLAPGKKAASVHFAGVWDRDLGTDLDDLVHRHDARVLVSLIEDHELPEYGIEGLYVEAEARGLEVRRFPIPDVGVPAAPVDALVRGILASARAGDRVVVHCIGGLGRTGTIAGCVLRELGYDAPSAIRMLHRVRAPNCPETRAQEAFIAGYR